MMLFAAAGGALIAAGVVGVVFGLPPAPDRPAARRRPNRLRRIPRRTWYLLGAGLVGGFAAWLATGWVLAFVAGPVAAVGLPTLLDSNEPTRRIARLEAMEEWTRSLAGVLTVGIGLEQALVTTLRSAPVPISAEVHRLVARLRARWSTEAALRAFGDELADPTGDLLTGYLLLAARRRGSGLATVLEGLAESVAADVRARRQVEADRAKPRTTARWVTLISTTVLAVLALTGDYVAPYATPIGQVVLVTLLSTYVGCLYWLRKMTEGPAPERLFRGTAS